MEDVSGQDFLHALDRSQVDQLDRGGDRPDRRSRLRRGRVRPDLPVDPHGYLRFEQRHAPAIHLDHAARLGQGRGGEEAGQRLGDPEQLHRPLGPEARLPAEPRGVGERTFAQHRLALHAFDHPFVFPVHGGSESDPESQAQGDHADHGSDETQSGLTAISSPAVGQDLDHGQGQHRAGREAE